MIPGFFAAGAMGATGGGGGGSYFDEVTTDAPVMWWRHGEASGTTMVAEAGPNGFYAGSTLTLGQSALYSGGPTCVLMNGGRGQYDAAGPPALNSLTVECIAQFNSLSGFSFLVNNDDAINRKWQMRMNGTNIEFVKIVGGASTQSVASGFSTGTPYHIAITVSSTGIVTIYANGSVLLTSSALGSADYGSTGAIQIGFTAGGGGAGSTNLLISESAIYNTALSSGRVAAHASAAGL